MSNYTNRLWHDKRFLILEANHNEDYANLEGYYSLPEVAKGLKGDISWVIGWSAGIGPLYYSTSKRSFSDFMKGQDLNREKKFLREKAGIDTIRLANNFGDSYYITPLYNGNRISSFMGCLCIDYKDFKILVKEKYK